MFENNWMTKSFWRKIKIYYFELEREYSREQQNRRKLGEPKNHLN